MTNICGNSAMLTDSLCSLSLCRLFFLINVPFLTLKRRAQMQARARARARVCRDRI